jgi:hypothetical protein
VKLLTFQARRFAWRSFQVSLDGLQHVEVEDELTDTVVAFVHAEASDAGEDEGAAVVRKAAKHLKWVAGKRGWKRVVLHSFTHLGAGPGDPELARSLLERLAERLAGAGYEVRQTPFGHLCEWELAVHGESMAKVWKEL